MGTVMQRENERGRLMVPACSTELSTRIERQSGSLTALAVWTVCGTVRRVLTLRLAGSLGPISMGE